MDQQNKNQLYLVEYKALKEEISNYQRLAYQMEALSVTTVGALLALGFRTEPPLYWVTVPAVIVIFGAANGVSVLIRSVYRDGSYIRVKFEELLFPGILTWESCWPPSLKKYRFYHFPDHHSILIICTGLLNLAAAGFFLYISENSNKWVPFMTTLVISTLLMLPLHRLHRIYRYDRYRFDDDHRSKLPDLLRLEDIKTTNDMSLSSNNDMTGDIQLENKTINGNKDDFQHAEPND